MISQQTTVGDGIPVTWSAGDGSAIPALLVVPSIFGVAQDLLARMGELAAGGAIVAAFDPFWRVAPGVLAYDDFQAAFARVEKVDRETVYSDMKQVVAHLREHGRANGKVAGLGICFGGPFCLLAAADGVIDGVVTWHGSRMHNWIERAAEMRVPMKHHFGGADPFVPMEQVEQIQQAFAGRDDVDFHIHEGASHGFSHSGAAYQQRAAEAAVAGAAAMLQILR